MLEFPPSDAWQLAHGETTMCMNEHLDSDEELMPSFYDSDSPDSEDDINSEDILSFTLLDFNACRIGSDTFRQALHLKRSPRQN